MTSSFISAIILTSVVLPAAPAPRPVAASGDAAACQTIPSIIRVDRFLQPVVTSLLAKSPTFRRQCETLARSRKVRVTITAANDLRRSSGPRARATIGRHEFGLLSAHIVVPMTGDHAELIPHEFEHVLEQLEGVDLPALVRGGKGAVEVAEGVYETERARQAGLAAAAEVHARNSEPAVGAIKTVGRLWRSLGSRAKTSPARASRAARPYGGR